jgi:hypothetical protein
MLRCNDSSEDGAMLEWFSITYNVARLGLEAQNATAFRLLRLAGGITKTATYEIAFEAIAAPVDHAPAPVAAAPERRSAASKVHKKSTAVKKRSKGTK